MAGGSRARLRPRAIALLAAGERVDRAAAALGINERTLRRWAADPAFAAEVQAAQSQAFERVRARMEDGMTAAADALVALLGSPSDRVRMQAAGHLIGLGLRVREHARTEAESRPAPDPRAAEGSRRIDELIANAHALISGRRTAAGRPPDGAAADTGGHQRAADDSAGPWA